MDEENKEEIKKEEPAPTEDKPAEGSKPPTTTLISQADLAAERLEKALRAERENLKMREALMVRDALGGVGGGHAEPTLMSEEDKKIKDAAEFFKGTALEKAIRPDAKK